MSPHIDDIFLSLYSFITSDFRNERIVAVNAFSTTDHLNQVPKEPYSASSIRMNEELRFAKHLSTKGIDYRPVFLGLQDASLELAPGARESWRNHHKLDQWGEDLVRKRFDVGSDMVIRCLIRQFGSSHVYFPVGIGHVDHVFLGRVGRTAEEHNVSFYMDVPYSSDYPGLKEIKRSFGLKDFQTKRKRLNHKERMYLFSKLFPSQSNPETLDRIRKAGCLGECVFSEPTAHCDD